MAYEYRLLSRFVLKPLQQSDCGCVAIVLVYDDAFHSIKLSVIVIELTVIDVCKKAEIE